ncbi:glycosyl hydrolase family 5 [Actinoplanes sp. SE50]|uniref:GH12 family glycosyl hydrolase domain-containing protein n=1 Tax=unclassified Actinoplanes TaxID=2626549 RepID=UPI00023EC2F0|nr:MULTISPECIES: cellulose binding domain-containing protein [unclassified Actinoplanes]AEV85816.1 Endoglucanase E-4 [Actinoplanes sp. SE50/110]ATO84210.1 glycosyl hydrolase family 5 [Actinoplanes sp. SE50]SLM01620.1 glycosyl hydrolase family 5 [Actinoplanes sp. SE50/110]
MQRKHHALVAALVLVASGLFGLTLSSPAQADTRICDQYGSTTIGGRYVVMNNRWGTSAEQCITVTGTGFSIASQQGTGNTSGAPVSYPAVYYGCHYTNCSPGTTLPLRVSAISSATSSISYTFVSGATYDAAYDIWLDPRPNTTGVNAQEIMIWFNRQGSIQPIGSRVATATIGGRSWEVWQGSNGSNAVVSYVAPSPVSSWSFSVLDFINDVKNRGAITSSWYLTSIQAGFEPWIGGAGLAVTNFSAAVDGGGAPSGPGTPSSPSNPGTSGCQVTYAPNVWNTGYTADVTVANTGGGAVNGWALGFTLPAGQTITSSWNATLSGNSGAITARNVSFNGAIPAGGSTSFGFQGAYSGSFAKPASFTLNGTACAIG